MSDIETSDKLDQIMLLLWILFNSKEHAFYLQATREREPGLVWGVIKSRNIFNVDYSYSDQRKESISERRQFCSVTGEVY
jgi:hypothetical protein